MSDEPDGDGVALVSTEHPIEVTDAMLIAGENTWRAAPRPSETVKDIVRDIYLAMVRAAPYHDEDISEDSVEDVEIEVRRDPELVDAVAHALSGVVDWATVTDSRKEHFRYLASVAIKVLHG